MSRADCSEWALTINDLAMNIASRGEGMDLDSASKAISNLTGVEVSRDTVRDSIIDASENGSRDLTQSEKNIRAIRSEAREDERLTTLIAAHENAMAKGEEPVSRARSKAIASDIIKKKRAILAHHRRTLARLKNKLPESDASKIKRVEAQIAELEDVIQKGDFVPKIKPAPTPKSKELELLEFKRSLLRRQIRNNVQSFKPQAVWNKTFDVLNIPRAIMTSFDFSAVFRQGGFFVFSNPKLVGKNLGPMFRAAGSKKAAFNLNQDIDKRRNAVWYRRGKLHISDLDGSLSQREEAYQTSLARFIPGIAASERAYVTFLNQLRVDAFDAFSQTLTQDGELTIQQAEALGKFINVATGRGGLGPFENAAVALNVAFFSPRLLASRFQMIAGAISPKRTFKADQEVRKIIHKQYAKFTMGIGLFYAMSALAFGDDDDDFFDIEINPLSSDFGKLRFGNTRVDPLFGMSQTIVLLARAGAGRFKSASTGNIRKLRGADVGFGKRNVIDVAQDFFRNKLSPIAGTVVDHVAGTDFIGEPVTAGSSIEGLLVPMSLNDLVETIQEQGLPRGAAISTASIFGMGVQTWGQRYEDKTTKELRLELKQHTFQSSKIVVRKDSTTGEERKFRVNRGEPHKGQEGRVASIRDELKARAERSGAKPK